MVPVTCKYLDNFDGRSFSVSYDTVHPRELNVLISCMIVLFIIILDLMGSCPLNAIVLVLSVDNFKLYFEKLNYLFNLFRR